MRNAACERQVFAERFASDLIQAHARRTSRVDIVTHATALALGGRPRERLTERLSMPVKPDAPIQALLCSDLDRTSEDIVAWSVHRWRIETSARWVRGVERFC